MWKTWKSLCTMPCRWGDMVMKGAWINKLIHEIHRHLSSVCVTLTNHIWSWFLKLASLLSHCVLVAEDGINKPQHLCPAPHVIEDCPQCSYLLSQCCSLPTSEKGGVKMNPPFLVPGYLGRSLCKWKLWLIFLLQFSSPVSWSAYLLREVLKLFILLVIVLELQIPGVVNDITQASR